MLAGEMISSSRYMLRSLPIFDSGSSGEAGENGGYSSEPGDGGDGAEKSEFPNEEVTAEDSMLPLSAVLVADGDDAPEPELGLDDRDSRISMRSAAEYSATMLLIYSPASSLFPSSFNIGNRNAMP